MVKLTTWTDFDNLDNAGTIRTKLNDLGNNVDSDLTTVKNFIEKVEQYGILYGYSGLGIEITDTPNILSAFDNASSQTMTVSAVTGKMFHSVAGSPLVEISGRIKALTSNKLKVSIYVNNAEAYTEYIEPVIFNGTGYISKNISTQIYVATSYEIDMRVTTETGVSETLNISDMYLYAKIIGD